MEEVFSLCRSLIFLACQVLPTYLYLHLYLRKEELAYRYYCAVRACCDIEARGAEN